MNTDRPKTRQTLLDTHRIITESVYETAGKAVDALAEVHKHIESLVCLEAKDDWKEPQIGRAYNTYNGEIGTALHMLGLIIERSRPKS